MLPSEKRLKTKQQLKDWLDWELRNYPSGIKAMLPTETAILRKHQILLRKTEYYSNTGNKLLALLYKLRLHRLQNLYAIHVPINTCGKGLHIMHVGPVLINAGAVVGENCALHMNTALVAGGTNDEAPVIGNNVVIGVGAVVLGGVHIASYTAIGANAVVNKDVTEEDTAVAGVPARKISNNGSSQWNKSSKTKNPAKV